MGCRGPVASLFCGLLLSFAFVFIRRIIKDLKSLGAIMTLSLLIFLSKYLRMGKSWKQNENYNLRQRAEEVRREEKTSNSVCFLNSTLQNTHRHTHPQTHTTHTHTHSHSLTLILSSQISYGIAWAAIQKIFQSLYNLQSSSFCT